MARMSTRRKLAIASWGSPKEGNIYGKLTVDAGPAVAWIEEQRERTGEKITITHLVGKACALALHRAPSRNGRILFGRFVEHRSVDVAFLVAIDGGSDLAKARIRDVDRKPVAEIAAELGARAERLKQGKDDDFEKSKGLLRALPTWLIRPLVGLIGWLASCLGLSIPALGIERFPFGSCIVTSVGMLGLDEGFAPPTPWAHVPLYVLVGALRKRPAVVDDKIVIQEQLTITATIDHRFIDGYQGAILARAVREVFADPTCLDRDADGGAGADGA